MRKFNLFIAGCTLSLLSINLTAQNTFQKEFDVLDVVSDPCPTRTFELGTAVAENPSNHDYYITGGYTKGSCNTTESALIKLNERGEWQWAKGIPSGYYTDVKWVSAPTPGLVLAGCNSDHLGGLGKFELVRTDANGDVSSHKIYAPGNAVCNKVQTALSSPAGMPDGFIAVGTISVGGFKRVYITKVQDDLTLTWDNELFFANVNCEGLSVIQTPDKGFLVTGNAGDSAWLIKLTNGGAVSWQKTYSMAGTNIIGKDIVITSGTFPSYFMLGNTTGVGSDILLSRFDPANGNLYFTFSLSSSSSFPNESLTATGVVEGMSGFVTISGHVDNIPLLYEMSTTSYNASVFSKVYWNMRKASTVIKTADQGFMICGTGTNWQNFYATKTTDYGMSDCYETPKFLNGGAPTLTSTTNTYSTLAPTRLGSPGPISFTINASESTQCENYCRNVAAVYSDETVHNCFGAAPLLSVNCPSNAAYTSWFLSTNPNAVGSGGMYITPPLFTNADYIARCYNADSCLLYEVTYHITTPAPVAYQPTYITACYGQTVHLQSPCNAGESTQWTYPSVPGSDIDIVATQDELFTVECRDFYGCLISTHEIGMTVTPAAGYAPIILNKCVGESIDLSTYGCLFTDDNNNTVLGPFTLPQGTHHFSGMCQVVIGGCVHYQDIYIHVNYCGPIDPPGGGDGRMANPSTENVVVHTVGLYPNPATNAVQVSVSLGKEETFSLQVVDMLGKTVINLQHINEGELSLDIAALATGVYQLEISVGGEIIRKKLVKQ